MTQPFSQNPISGARQWLMRIPFVLLFMTLIALFVMGLDAYYKYLLLNTIGINGSPTNTGEIQLSPIDGLPAAKSGLQEGDVLLAVNGVKVSSNVLRDLRNISLSANNQVLIEVRGNDGIQRTSKIHLDAPIPNLFGASAITLARIQILFDILSILVFSIPALIIFLKRSTDRLGMFVAVTLLMLGFRFTEAILFEPYALASLLVFIMYAASRIFLLIFLFIFPNGVYAPAWTRRFVYLGGAWAVISLFIPALYGLSGGVLELAILTTGLWSQIYRYRHVSSVQEKQQTKWIVFGIVVAFAVNYLLFIVAFLPSIRESGLANLRYQIVSQPVVAFSLFAMPLAVGISIFRYRLYEIDIIINRTLVYGSLTAILSGLSIALIGFFQRLTLAVTGEKSEVATVMTTLLVASVITPLKNWLQGFMDRRFKETPNAEKKLRAFAEQVRTRLFAVNAEQITRGLLEESVIAFDASGGAVFLDGANPIHATRTWNGQDQLKVQIRSGQKVYGSLALGAKSNGSDYSNEDRTLINAVVEAVASAIDEDNAQLSR